MDGTYGHEGASPSSATYRHRAPKSHGHPQAGPVHRPHDASSVGWRPSPTHPPLQPSRQRQVDEAQSPVGLMTSLLHLLESGAHQDGPPAWHHGRQPPAGPSAAAADDVEWDEMVAYLLKQSRSSADAAADATTHGQPHASFPSALPLGPLPLSAPLEERRPWRKRRPAASAVVDGMYDGHFSPDENVIDRTRRQLITPTAATAARLLAPKNRDSREEDESEAEDVNEGIQRLQTYRSASSKARRLWDENANLHLVSLGMQYLNIYRQKVWVYATTHPSAMTNDNVRWTLARGFDGWSNKEDATLGVSVLTVLAQGAAQAGEKQTAREFFMKARQAIAYIGSESCDYSLAEAMVSIAIYAHIEGEMEDKQIHNILDMAMNICRRIPALNSDAYHRCMFMKSIIGFNNEEDRRMLDEAFTSVKSLPYFTYFVDDKAREVMPYSISVLQGIADTAIVIFHVVLALNLRARKFADRCPPLGYYSMDNEIIHLTRVLTELESRLEVIALEWPPHMYLCLRMSSIAARAQCFWDLGLQRQALKCIEDYILLSQRRKKNTPFEYLRPPVLRSDQMILSILAEKDDGELVSELFEAMKLNEEKMPAVRKLRERYSYLLHRNAYHVGSPSFGSFSHPTNVTPTGSTARSGGPVPPPHLGTVPPPQPVTQLLFGNQDPTPNASPSAGSGRLDPQNAHFLLGLQQKEREMTTLEQRMLNVRAKTHCLDKRIESLEELVAAYESIISADKSGRASRSRTGPPRPATLEVGRSSSPDSPSSPTEPSGGVPTTIGGLVPPILTTQQLQDEEKFFSQFFADV